MVVDEDLAWKSVFGSGQYRGAVAARHRADFADCTRLVDGADKTNFVVLRARDFRPDPLGGRLRESQGFRHDLI
jgi:hypothetical protein